MNLEHNLGISIESSPPRERERGFGVLSNDNNHLTDPLAALNAREPHGEMRSGKNDFGSAVCYISRNHEVTMLVYICTYARKKEEVATCSIQIMTLA